MNAERMIQVSDDEEDEDDLISLMPESLGSISSLLGLPPNGSGKGSRLHKLLLSHRQRQHRRKGTGRVTRPLNLSFKKKHTDPIRDPHGLQDVAAFWASEDRKEAEEQKENAQPRLSRVRSKKSDRASKLDLRFLTNIDNEKLIEEEVEAPATFKDKSSPAANPLTSMLSKSVQPESLTNALEAYKKALRSLAEPPAFNFQRATTSSIPPPKHQETVQDSTFPDNAETRQSDEQVNHLDSSSPQTKRNPDVPTSSGHNGSEDKASVSAESAKSSVVSSPFPASLRRKSIDLERKRLSFDQIHVSPQANEVGDSDMTVCLPDHIPKHQLDAHEVQSGHTVMEERMEIDDTHDTPTSNHIVTDIAAEENTRQQHDMEDVPENQNENTPGTDSMSLPHRENETEENNNTEVPQDLGESTSAQDIQETVPQENAAEEMREFENILAEENVLAAEEPQQELQKDAKGDAGEPACENIADEPTPEKAEEPVQENITKKNAKLSRKLKRKAETQPSPWMKDAGSKWEDGKRCSTRYKSRPLEWWRGERLLYGRIHKALTTVIGVKHSSPLPPKPKRGDYGKEFKVDSFVPKQYEDLVKFAAI